MDFSYFRLSDKIKILLPGLNNKGRKNIEKGLTAGREECLGQEHFNGGQCITSNLNKENKERPGSIAGAVNKQISYDEASILNKHYN